MGIGIGEVVEHTEKPGRQETPAGDEQIVVFDLGDELFGIDIARVQEIIRWLRVTRVPEAPHFVEGIINLRGKVIPVIDLRRRFKLEAVSASKGTRIVVVDIHGLTVGLIVDAVSEVLHVPLSTVEPPSPVITTAKSTYLRGIVRLEDRLISLLDLERVLAQESASLGGDPT